MNIQRYSASNFRLNTKEYDLRGYADSAFDNKLNSLDSPNPMLQHKGYEYEFW